MKLSNKILILSISFLLLFMTGLFIRFYFFGSNIQENNKNLNIKNQFFSIRVGDVIPNKKLDVTLKTNCSK